MVNSVKQGGYESKHGCRAWLAFNLSHTIPSWPLYIGGQVSRIGWDSIQITISTYDMNSYLTSITIGPSIMGLRGTQLTGSIIYTLIIVRYNQKKIG
jgi:hypothetical protein